MKRNKRRMDARLKPYIWDRIEKIAAKTESTYTEVIEEALEKGLNWIIKKVRKELDAQFLIGDPTPVQIYSTGIPEEFTKDIEKTIEIAKTKWLKDD